MLHAEKLGIREAMKNLGFLEKLHLYNLITTSDFSEKTPSSMLSGASHFRGSLTAESLS